MPTDEERREIARRLREVDMDDFGSYSEEHEVIETILGCWCDCEHENEPLNERLADLIEPIPPVNSTVECDGFNYTFKMQHVDRDALLALADEMGELCGPWRDCGEHYARRIREALGEEA